MANGAIVPISRIGTASSTVTASSEPRNAPAAISSSASTAPPRNGRPSSGTSAVPTAAACTTMHITRRSGRRSASRPPSQ
jgi:hypothetical protein